MNPVQKTGKKYLWTLNFIDSANEIGRMDKTNTNFFIVPHMTMINYKAMHKCTANKQSINPFTLIYSVTRSSTIIQQQKCPIIKYLIP